MPQARKYPRSEVGNIIDKLWYKRFASERGLRTFSATGELKTCDFQDFRPLLFCGMTTLHANNVVGRDADRGSLTLLAHFFDSSPRYGVGALLRTLRAR